MLRTKVYRIRAAIKSLGLRLSWNELPALSTHGLAFLVGTVFLRAGDASPKAMPQQWMVPADRWIKHAQSPPLSGQSVYLLRKKSADGAPCLTWSKALKIWVAPGAKGPRYLLIPPDQTLLSFLLKPETLVLETGHPQAAPCASSSTVAYD